MATRRSEYLPISGQVSAVFRRSHPSVIADRIVSSCRHSVAHPLPVREPPWALLLAVVTGHCHPQCRPCVASYTRLRSRICKTLAAFVSQWLGQQYQRRTSEANCDLAFCWARAIVSEIEGPAVVDAAWMGQSWIAERCQAHASGKRKRLPCLGYDQGSCTSANGVGFAGNPHARTPEDLILGPRGLGVAGSGDSERDVTDVLVDQMSRGVVYLSGCEYSWKRTRLRERFGLTAALVARPVQCPSFPLSLSNTGFCRCRFQEKKGKSEMSRDSRGSDVRGRAN
jgi:hypothetical protein